MLWACGQLPPGPKIGLSWAWPLDTALRPLGQNAGMPGAGRPSLEPTSSSLGRQKGASQTSKEASSLCKAQKTSFSHNKPKAL